MAEFQLDTSGIVRVPEGSSGGEATIALYKWHNLNPVTQGYVEALFESAWPDLFAQFVAKGMSEPEGHEDAVRPEFSDLAPETLARIMEDCERFLIDAADRSKAAGALFFRSRQRGEWKRWGYAPLTIELRDDGKVYLS